MGKGQRNKDVRNDALVAPRTKKKVKKVMPKWLKTTIAITITVIVVLGIVALVLHNNGTFRRMQVLIESQSGEYDINRQVATFLAWEIEYYNAYVDFLTTDDQTLKTQYNNDASAFAHQYALARVTQEMTNQETGEVVSSPRDAIDNTLAYMINFVAVCDYAAAQGVTLTEDEWKGDITITWYAGMADALPITWDGLHEMMVVDQTYGLAYSNLDLFLDDYFGGGMNSDDVEQALKLICMYEKYLAIYSDARLTDAKENEASVNKYISDNPNFFYTVEYLSYETEDVALKDALLATKDKTPEAFKSEIAKDWFDKQGNYKDTYNAYVALKKAENTLADIKDLVDTDEKKAWTEKLTALGATQKTYEVANKDQLEADMSKWLFAKRAKYDEELVKTKDGFYVLAAIDQKLDADGDVSSTTVYELKFALEDGVSHEGDAEFKNNILKTMLINAKLSTDEKPTVAYKTAIENAKVYAEQIKGLASADVQTKMAQLGDRFKKTISENTTDVKAPILNAVFDGNDPVAGEILTAEESDTVAYLIYIDSVAKVDEAGIHNVVIYYVAIDADVYYQILTELVQELEKALPAATDAYYTANPTEGSYQHWFFAGAKQEDGTFKSPVAANETKHFEAKVKSPSGVGEDTTKYTVYFVIDPLHLDTSYLVNGGYISYTGADADVIAKLKDKTGADLIAALRSLSPNSTNVATVSETIKQSSVDEEIGKWLFDDERKANDFKAGIKGADGKTYVAVYLGRELNWKVTGQTYLASDKVNTWILGLAAQYKPNETVLSWIGDPTPEKEPETTTAATTEATPTTTTAP